MLNRFVARTNGGLVFKADGVYLILKVFASMIQFQYVQKVKNTRAFKAVCFKGSLEIQFDLIC